VFTHRFKANDHEKGKKTVIEGFSRAIEAAGQTRRTYPCGDFRSSRASGTLLLSSEQCYR
jgi:hypothetical protein